MQRFRIVFFRVFALTVVSAVLALAVGVADGFILIPHSERLITVFTDGFKTGLGGLLGLLVGSPLRGREY